MISIDAETNCILLPEHNAARFILFQRLGFGSILGFIVAGVLVGPSTPGPVPVQALDELSSIANARRGAVAPP
ncbi:hypothetical protein [Thiorhodococcus minor]|uniref:Uncharacterized protein n=1 Tax=Thiorhodococcus minor TaxID=57489 RepID=A0A6M0K560_9GAMM|nr:hypothetical protein [Thiorhodococcus minor]NEV64926.1 hypothetical protein [Thiorhodococcus minor]